MYNAEHWYEFANMRAPGLVRMALEWRAPAEFAATLVAQPWLAQAPRGRGDPVLIFPGLMASDASTKPLRRYLESLGHAVYGWEQGSNLGPREGVLEANRARLGQLHREHRQKVALVGWSLGGIYARELAKESPELASMVITMGTPFTGHPKATNAWRLYELVTGHKIGAPEIHEPLRAPPPVPTTSIWSRTDGIVHWACSVERSSDHTENIEIQASHFGIGLNPLAWYAVADRLAQPRGKWKPFDRNGKLERWFYRDPARKSLW
jgi:pimeloyl-ACP methyl ester carboxylesterase